MNNYVNITFASEVFINYLYINYRDYLTSQFTLQKIACNSIKQYFFIYFIKLSFMNITTVKIEYKMKYIFKVL